MGTLCDYDRNGFISPGKKINPENEKNVYMGSSQNYINTIVETFQYVMNYSLPKKARITFQVIRSNVRYSSFGMG